MGRYFCRTLYITNETSDFCICVWVAIHTRLFLIFSEYYII